MRHLLRKIAVVGFFCTGSLVIGQQIPRLPDLTRIAYVAPSGYRFATFNTVSYLPPAPSITAPPFTFEPLMIKPVQQPCAKFVEPFAVSDYSGPMSRVIATISQRMDGGATVRAARRHSLRPAPWMHMINFSSFWLKPRTAQFCGRGLERGRRAA